MRSVCGLDVHKDSVYLCILSEDGELIEKVFGVLTFQLHQMRDLLLAHHVEKVSMESTSVYWIPIWRILAPHFHLQLVNPYFIIRKNRTRRKLTGTQIQNIGIGATAFDKPSQRKKLRVSICRQ